MTKLITRAAALFVALTAISLVACSAAFAATEDVAERVFVLPPTWLMLLSGFSASALTALITKSTARPWIKAALNLVLVAIAAVIEYIVSHVGVFSLSEILDIFVMTFLLNLGVWLGLIRPGLIPPEATAPDSGIV